MADHCAATMAFTTVFSTISRELHPVTSGLIGGAKYGVKIRLPHALLMTFLFRPNLSASQKLKRVLQLSLEHAVKLAAFASIYKVMIASLKWLSRHLRNSKDSETVWKSFGRVILSMIGQYETHLSHVSLFCLLSINTCSFIYLQSMGLFQSRSYLYELRYRDIPSERITLCWREPLVATSSGADIVPSTIRFSCTWPAECR
jgi:hypothetical protein